ncbi:MAG TPA: DUF5684 domain-containing protein [Candidatus Saccharimonadales bacterium]|nr:DUF5684 domain-containing protein [Candidatus Saccharimonadales bacterium]
MNIETFASSAGGIGAGMLVVWLIIAVLAIAGMWATFSKAGKPGWAAIIPIYNIYVLMEVAGRPGWWLILYLIPVVNIVISLIVSIDVAKAFGKSSAFGVIGLWLFSIIGYLMLGFGDAKYQAGGTGSPAAPTGPTPPVTPTNPTTPTSPTPPAATPPTPPQAPVV